MNELFWNDFWSNHGSTTEAFLDRGDDYHAFDAYSGLEESHADACAEDASLSAIATDELCRRGLARERDNINCALRR